jgi:hypothetical protein
MLPMLDSRFRGNDKPTVGLERATDMYLPIRQRAALRLTERKAEMSTTFRPPADDVCLLANMPVF